MNAQVQELQTSAADIAAVVKAAAPEQRLDDVTKRLSTVQTEQLRTLLDKQNELIQRLNGLADLEDVAIAERQRAIIEADLESTRTEIAKRTENVGVMASELMALYDELGLQAQKANADSPEDDMKRQRAKDAVQAAMKAVADAESAVTTAKAGVTTAEDSFEFFGIMGKVKKVDSAKAQAANAESEVEKAKAKLSEAEQGVVDVEAQIEIDKADRIRRASLSENFALIRQFTQNAVTVLKEDVEQTEARRAVTEKSLESALAKKTTTARDLDATRDELAKLERDAAREAAALGEIPDQGSEAYAKQQEILAGIEKTLTETRGAELKLNTQLMALTAAIEANKSSLAGLITQRDTAEVYIIKLETAEKTAAILGHNIDRMVKNTTQETASDALDRASDKMILSSVELGIQAEVSSAKNRNDAIERNQKLMEQLHAVRDSGDQAMASQAERYLELDKQMREGFAAMGVDLEMSHLHAAAEAFERRPGPVPADTNDVIY